MKKRIIRTHNMQYPARPEKVFPLLCPIREYEWIEVWKCELVYSESGVAEQDCVFKTNFPSEGPEETWVVSRYEAPRLVEFVRINPWRSMRYTISLTDNGDGTTRADWTQIITALNEEGMALLQQVTAEVYREKMTSLESILNHYLTTGQMKRLGG